MIGSVPAWTSLGCEAVCAAQSQPSWRCHRTDLLCPRVWSIRTWLASMTIGAWTPPATRFYSSDLEPLPTNVRTWIPNHRLDRLCYTDALEVVLGIDNIVLISILTDSFLEPNRRARLIGLALAMLTRILLCFRLPGIQLTAPLFVVRVRKSRARPGPHPGRALLWPKSTHEIHGTP